MAQPQALIVRGGWDGHQPIETTDVFRPFLSDQGYEIRVVSDTRIYADSDYLADVDLIVQCNTMSSITADELTGLRTAVAAGTGLMGWHGGIADSYRSSPGYLQLVGGQFVDHPAKAPCDQLSGDMSDSYIPHMINIVPAQAEHPIVSGLEDFELTTEQYWVLTDDYNDVLATTTIAARDFDPWCRPITCPAVWTRRWGTGRVVVVTPGHQQDIVQHPSVAAMIERGMLWAGR